MIVKPLYYFENITNPTEFEIDTVQHYNDTTFLVRDRVEKGWAADFIFNTTGATLVTGNTFYYWGIKNEYNPANYIDNNVSFDFTVDGRIRWRKAVYSNYCGKDHLVLEDSDTTPVLCTGGTSDDFNISIVFERNLEYGDCCELENDGGLNDLFTGWTIVTTGITGGTYPNGLHNDSAQQIMNEIIDGEGEYTTVWTINDKWYAEKYKRLGTLKIFHNGKLIYTNKEWEEVIPTIRQSKNIIAQVWGGGTLGSGDIHNGVSQYETKKITYYEKPLSYVDIRNNYITHQSEYSITECNAGCYDPVLLSPPTPTPTVTPTNTPTPTGTPISTPTPTITSTPTNTPTISLSGVGGAGDGGEEL